MIRDTCPCGAEFEADHATAAIPSSSEQRAHNQWLEAHKQCRSSTYQFINAEQSECPKCNDTGERPTKTELFFEGERHRVTVPCDCKASK